MAMEFSGEYRISARQQQVWDALENGFSKYEDGAGRFPQVSGLKVVADVKKPAGSRVVSVMVGDKALDLAATYKLATNDYMLDGGDGYTALKGGKVAEVSTPRGRGPSPHPTRRVAPGPGTCSTTGQSRPRARCCACTATRPGPTCGAGCSRRPRPGGA